MTANDLRIVADIVNKDIPDGEIFREIKWRAVRGHYNSAGYDSLEEQEIAQLENAGFKVTNGQNGRSSWYVIEW